MKEKIKEVLRGHVHKHEYSVDPADIWAGMQKEISTSKKKDRRGLFALFIGLSILVVAGFLFLPGMQGDSMQVSELSEITESDQSTQSQKRIAATTKEEKDINSVKTNNSPLNQKNNNKQSNSLAAKKNLTATSNRKNTIETVETKIKLEESTASQTFSSIQSSATKVVDENQPLPFSSKLRLGSQLVENDKSEDEKANDEVVSQADISSEILATKVDLVKAQARLDIINQLELMNIGLLSFNRQRELINDDYTLVDVQKTNSKRKSISLTAGMGVFAKKVIAFDESHSDYAIAREKYEKPLEVFTAQAIVNIPLVSKLSLSTGIQYLQFNEAFDWKGSYFLDRNGNVINSPAEFLVGENYYQEVSHSITTYNKAQLFSVPVLLGISNRHKRITYGLRAGANFHLRTQTQGKILATNLTPISVLESNFGIGLQSKFELGYFITPGLELLGEISVLQVTAAEELINQRLRSYSLGLGLRQTL